MNARLGSVLVAASVLAIVGAGCGSDDPPALAIEHFDAAQQAWGDAPLTVQYAWRVRARPGARLTCKLDDDGDGATDRTIEDCPADTTAATPETLPAHTFTGVGEHRPRLVVTDDRGHSAQAEMKVFANLLEYSDRVVYVEKRAGFVSAEPVGQDRVTLTYDAAASVPDLQPDDVVWGTSAGGYLIKVTSATKQGAQVLVLGTAATYTDAVKRGFVGVRDAVAAMDGARCLDEACAGSTYEQVVLGEDGEPRPAATAASARRLVNKVGRGPAAFTLGGMQLFLKINVRQVTQGNVALEHSVTVGVNIKELVVDTEGLSVRRVHIDATPFVRYRFEMNATAPTKDWKWPIGDWVVASFYAQGIPLAIRLQPTIEAQLRAKLVASIGANLPFNATYDSVTGFGGAFAPEVVPQIGEPGFVENLAAVADPTGGFAGLEFRAGFTPKIMFDLLYVVDAFVEPTVWLSLEARAKTAEPSDVVDTPEAGTIGEICAIGKVAVNAALGIEAPRLDLATRFNGSSLEWQLWSVCTPHCLPGEKRCAADQHTVEACGSDGQNFAPVQTCVNGCTSSGSCLDAPATCTPSCPANTCGDDGCGHACACGSADLECNPFDKRCYPKGPSCADQHDDASCHAVSGCDWCGVPGAPGQWTCLPAGTSTCPPPCTPSCPAGTCGDDGCGHACACGSADLECNPFDKRCYPKGPSCADQHDDASCHAVSGCDWCGVPGAPGQWTCLPAGTSTCPPPCTPDCAGRACGDDGCGGSCGSCTGGKVCSSAGQCYLSCASQSTCSSCNAAGCAWCSVPGAPSLHTCLNTSMCSYPITICQ